MKHRDIFRATARIEQRSRLAKAWKVGNETMSENEDLGWFIVVTLGTNEFAFHHGPDKPSIVGPTISLVLEYTVPDDA